MAVTTIAARRPARRVAAATRLPLTLAALVVLQFSVYVDVWYHRHDSVEIETCFTYPHALVCAGWAAAGLLPAPALAERIDRRLPRRDWLPAGIRRC